MHETSVLKVIEYNDSESEIIFAIFALGGAREQKLWWKIDFFEDFNGYSSGNLVLGGFLNKSIETRIEMFWTNGAARKQKLPTKIVVFFKNMTVFLHQRL